ncbi:MAG: YncE family protein [Saprospiraceae bacterium]
MIQSFLKNKSSLKSSCIYFFVIALLLSGCSSDDEQEGTNDNSDGYPAEVSQIITTKCATAGCHNDISRVAAAGLSMKTWDRLFEGSRGGSAVVPYRTDQSFLLFFVNTDPEKGIVLSPTMPINQPALSAEEYTILKDWIEEGAPNSDGLVKFSDNPSRRKFYVTNQGCDMVAVFDAETQTLMRYIDVGSRGEIESPHQVKVSPDGKYWYTIFFSGTTIQKFDATDDSFVSEAEIGDGSWNTFRLSSDGKRAYVVNWSANGSIAVVDLENMTLKSTITGNGLFEWPHGSMLNEAEDVLYVTAQHGNFFYKIDLNDLDNPQVEKVSMNESSPTTISWLDGHEMELSPDGSKYFVTCEESNEVRVLQSSNDSVIAVIPTGVFPQEIAFSKSKPYLFVTCTEDYLTYPDQIGSVYVINYEDHTVVKTIFTGFQPHGITVDDQEERVYVAHRNVRADGPTPHHSTDCEGRNGFVTQIDLNTLELLPGYKVEVSVDPYSVSLRE